MGQKRSISIMPGTTIAGHLEVVKRLGEGAKSVVYLCRDRSRAGRQVAMKVLYPEVIEDEMAIKRFQNEVASCYEVNHPNVVKAYEYFHEGGLVGYTMEYITGGDLADRLIEIKKLSVPEAVNILAQVCIAVSAIHAAGVIHRDLKPENVFLAPNGRVKVGDFGISLMGCRPRITDDDSLLGTVGYVAPEYFENGHVDLKTDIYSLGVLGYRMITGVPPHPGHDLGSIILAASTTDPIKPSLRVPECPVELSSIIMKAMSRDPAKRYADAMLMLSDLLAVSYEGEVIEFGLTVNPHAMVSNG